LLSHLICKIVSTNNNQLRRLYRLNGSQSRIPVPVAATSLLLQTMHHRRSRVIWLELHGQHKRYK
jgi:hypothetical protein